MWAPTKQKIVQYYDETVAVGEIKGELERLEGIPREQLVLVHAGVELVDDASLSAYGLSEYNRSDEVSSRSQCCRFSRNIAQVTPKIINFYYQKIYLQDGSIQK